MKPPITTLKDLQKYRGTIKHIVKKYGGGNTRVLDVDPRGDLTCRENIRLLIDFPPYSISHARVIDLENELFRLLNRFVKVIDPVEEPDDWQKQALEDAVPL